MAFAVKAHQGQTMPGGDTPYVVHLCQVAMEVMAWPEADDLAVCCALLHDTIEDTAVTYHQVVEAFGEQTAQGVLALTKNADLPKPDQMADSLRRIRQQPKSVWMVKLSDRITNMAEPPPHWTKEKRMLYRREAEQIWHELSPAHEGLGQRLKQRITDYERYF